MSANSVTASIKVPFNKPVVLDRQEALLAEAIRNGHLSGNGPFTKRCEQLLEKIAGKKTLLVSSGTHALEMIPLLLDLKPGDEVILPSYTFSSTANAFALRGAVLRFADNDLFGNILPSEVERLLSKKTKAVMAVHYAGASADLDAISEICAKNSVPLVEDAAQAIGASYKGRTLGTIGELGCYSFHETKNVTSGEGGALILGNSKFLDRAEILREKGTNRARFFQGLADKYTWVDIGSSYLMSDMNAAYLYPQLDDLPQITKRRKQIWEGYKTSLAAEFAEFDIRVLGTPAHNTPNYHLFAMIMPNHELRTRFISFMKSNGIICPFHYVSLHTSPFGARFYSGRPEHLPGCEKLSQSLVRFPLFYNLTEEEQGYVIEKARKWLLEEKIKPRGTGKGHGDEPAY
ncbi:MAG: dTDP-4-amino-4,6-dideoxygalactose transaminase [Bdellovibrionota bacterium]